ncbi:MAG: nucleoside hydrolase [Paenibacillus sp.]|nr:nucleoside hydrolase [Paenibacillus sp.]
MVSNNYRALFNSFGVLNPDGNRMAVIGGQVRFEPVQPEYKEAVKYIRSLYAGGLRVYVTKVEKTRVMASVARIKLFALAGLAATILIGGLAIFILMHINYKPIRRLKDAAADLIERANRMPDGEPLYVAVIGAPTNVASAIWMDPGIVRKIVIRS